MNNRDLPLIGLGFMVAMGILATKAEPQGRNCGPRQSVVERLAEGYGESRQTIAMASNGSIF